MNRQQQALLGTTAICLGSWLLYQSYDKAGVRRPFWTRLLPGA